MTALLAPSMPALELDALFADGDDTVLRAAYDPYGALVLALCRRALPSEDAEEVTQQVFLDAWHAKERYDAHRGALAGWLVGIARYKVIDRLRSRARHRLVLGGRLPETADQASEVDRVADRLHLDRCGHCTAELTALRSVVDRVRAAGLPQPDGDATGRS